MRVKKKKRTEERKSKRERRDHLTFFKYSKLVILLFKRERETVNIEHEIFYQNGLFQWREIRDSCPGLHVLNDILLTDQLDGILIRDIFTADTLEQFLGLASHEQGHHLGWQFCS